MMPCGLLAQQSPDSPGTGLQDHGLANWDIFDIGENRQGALSTVLTVFAIFTALFPLVMAEFNQVVSLADDVVRAGAAYLITTVLWVMGFMFHYFIPNNGYFLLLLNIHMIVLISFMFWFVFELLLFYFRKRGNFPVAPFPLPPFPPSATDTPSPSGHTAS
jgi:hypothetical protein